MKSARISDRSNSARKEKLKSILKGIWAFCSFLFVPQWGRKHDVRCKRTLKTRLARTLKHVGSTKTDNHHYLLCEVWTE